MCTSRLSSQGVDLFALKFYLDRARQKTRDTGLRDGVEDRMSLRSLVLTQYWSVTDRQTYRRTDLPCSIYSACKASFAVRCKNQNIRN